MTDTALALHAASDATVRSSAGVLDTSTIPGWGIDANPQNDPTYPYRDRSGDDHSGQWQRPAQQPQSVELLQSVEHKQRPAVFGSSSPPKWVSGIVRRQAFRWSESHWAHWLLLMGADRINVVEGLVEDVARGKVPNVPLEMGVRAEWKHNKSGLAAKLVIAAALSGVLYAFARSDGFGDDED